MKVEKRKYNKKTGKWESVIVEEDGDFVFSTGTNAPIRKSDKNKSVISVDKTKPDQKIEEWEISFFPTYKPKKTNKKHV